MGGLISFAVMFPSQSSGIEEKPMAHADILQSSDPWKAERNAVRLKISEQEKEGGKKLPKKKKLVYNKDYIL